MTETLDGYQLVAGERRLRAAQLAGLERIPAVVRQLADREQLELALVENLQREDLDPIEEAHAFRQLIDEFGVDPGASSPTRVGRARSTVANTLRLLDLIRASRQPSPTDAHRGPCAGPRRPAASSRRASLGPWSSSGLSVRQTEELVRRLREPRPEHSPARPRAADPDLERVEEDLRRALGTKVTPGPIAAGRPDRHRVLQRRGARAASTTA